MRLIRTKYQSDFEDEPENLPASGYETQLSQLGQTMLRMALLAVVAIAANSPTLVGGWLEQDAPRVTKNASLRAWQGIKPIWRLPHQFPDFSPVTYTTHLLEARVWGASSDLAAIGYRCVNLLFHVAAVLLLYHFLGRLEIPGAWVAAAVFAVHPVNVASVSWIAQRPVLIGTCFGLATLIVLLRLTGMNPRPPEPHPVFHLPDSRAKLLLIMSPLLTLTLGASPMIAALIGPAVLVLAWWERGRISRRDWLAAGPLLVVTVLIAAAAVDLAIRRGTLGEQMTLSGVAPLQRPLAAAEQIAFYAFCCLLPVRLLFAYQPFELMDPAMLAGAGMLVLAVIAAAAMKRSYGRGPLAAILLFVILILPATIWVDQDERLFGGWVGIQRLYPASVALIVGLVALVADFLLQRGWNFGSAVPVSAIIAGVAVLCVGVLGVERSLAYQNQSVLWQDLLGKDSSSVLAMVSMGERSLAEKPPDYNQAEQWFQKANTLKPGDPLPLLKLGALYEMRSQNDPSMRERAYAQYIAVLQKDPDNFEAAFGRARVLQSRGDSIGALEAYGRALQLHPNDPMVYNNIGLVHFQRGEMQQSRQNYEKALEINPRFTSARINLALTLYNDGDTDAAAAQLTKAVEIDRESYEAFMNAGAMLGQMREFPKAVRLFRQAVLLRNDAPEAYFNLGNALMGLLQDPKMPSSQRRGTIGEVVFNFEKCVELAEKSDPRRPQYQQTLDAARALQKQIAGG